MMLTFAGKEQIFYVTRNLGKLAIAQHALEPYGLEVVQAELSLIEPQYDSLEEIVSSKVNQAYKQLGQPCIAQDAGLMIDGWEGFPGAYTEFILRKLGNAGILKLMEGMQNRSASFMRCLAYLGGENKNPVLFHSDNPGTISEEEKGVYQPYTGLHYL